MADESERDRVGAEVAAAIKLVFEKNKRVTARKAPIQAHRALDALMAADTNPNRSAPQWAHDILDWLWDLLS
jgi:hypothetical protein